MVQFKESNGGYEIELDGNFFAHMSPHIEGLYLNNMRLSPNDLRVIAQKLAELLDYGLIPPNCHLCGGTPHYPKEIQVKSPENEAIVCKATIHLVRAR